MKSKIIRINDKTSLEVEIDGSKISNWKDYVNVIGEKLNFPEIDRYPKYDGYSDWMRDLSWLNQELMIIKIRHYTEFMKNNLKEKEIFFDLVNDIIEYWREEYWREEKFLSDETGKKTVIFCLID